MNNSCNNSSAERRSFFPQPQKNFQKEITFPITSDLLHFTPNNSIPTARFTISEVISEMSKLFLRKIPLKFRSLHPIIFSIHEEAIKRLRTMKNHQLVLILYWFII